MSENLPQRRSPAEILDSDLLRLCGLPADSPEDVVELVRLVAVLVERNGDGPAAAAVALTEAMGRVGRWNVQSLPFGYEGPIVEHKGWVKRDDVALHLAQVGGVLVGGRFNAEVTDEAIAEAVCNYWLCEKPFDAWRPGMKSGSGWTAVVRAQPAGLARARELAAAPAEAPLALKRDGHTQPDPAGITTPALLGQGEKPTSQSPGHDQGKGVADPGTQNTKDDYMTQLLSLYTNGVSDERLLQAVEVQRNPSLSSNEKLYRLNNLIPIPLDASAETLAKTLGVSDTAVKKTKWWKDRMKNRRSEEAKDVDDRRSQLKERAQRWDHDRW